MQIVYQTYNPLVLNSPEKSFLAEKYYREADTSNNSHRHLDLSVSPVSFLIFKTVSKGFPLTAGSHLHPGVLLPVPLVLPHHCCLTHLVDLLISETNTETVRHDNCLVEPPALRD